MQYTTLIDAATTLRLIGKPGIAVVDCRFELGRPDAGRQAFVAGHIPTSVHVDLEGDLSAAVGVHTGRHPLPDRAALAARLGALGIDAETQVIAYDQANGLFAARLWWTLRWLGHAGVAVLDGGLAAWRTLGGVLQSGAATPTPRAFSLRAPLQSLVTTAEVLTRLGRPDFLLVDARAPERFAGTVEPLDPVAGHVPSAVNFPLAQNLEANGHFLPPAELRRRWLARLAGRDPAQVVTMCGSGVTACHALLALEAAGLPGAALYAGSWSEWIRDPARPVAQGAA